MSVISMLDRDLALVYPPLTPVRLLQLLSEHGVRTIEVPDDELDTLGPNVLAGELRQATPLFDEVVTVPHQRRGY